MDDDGQEQLVTPSVTGFQTHLKRAVATSALALLLPHHNYTP